MKKFLLAALLCISEIAFADPAWFDRRQADYTATHLEEVYRTFARDIEWTLGRQHPLYRSVYSAWSVENRLVRQIRTPNYPFDTLYENERNYYRVDWLYVQNDWRRAGITDWRLVDEYEEVQFLSDKLHRIFNPPPAQWYGSCRVVLETVWGDDLQNFYGSSVSTNRQTAINRARADGVNRCESVRRNDGLKRCVVDTSRCTATQR